MSNFSHNPSELAARLRLGASHGLNGSADDSHLLIEAAQQIEKLQMALQEALKDAERLRVAGSDLDCFMFDTKTRADYVQEAAARHGREIPTDEDELEGLRRMIDYQISAFSDEH